MNVLCAELVGTAILVLLGDGVVANVLLRKSKAQDAGWIVIAAGWGVAVALAVYVVGWASGGHINPAVTIGMVVIGKLPIEQIPWYVGGQLIGGFLGAVLVWLAYLPHWSRTEDPLARLSVFATVPAIRDPVGNLICEIIGTAVLLIGVLGVLNTHNEIAKGFAPCAIGMIVFGIGLSLGGPTGYAINPARDLAPRLAHAVLPIPGKAGSDWRYAWIPVIGPVVGGILGAVLYSALVAGLSPLAAP